MGLPSSANEERLQYYQTVASATASVLSLIGSFYIIGRYWYARRLKAKLLSVYAASAHHLDVTKELIHIIAYFDLFGATGRAFGVLPTATFDREAGEPVTLICKLQAFVITFGDGAPIMWNFIMALNLYRWVCMGEDQQMLMKKIKWYIGSTLVFTVGIPSICLVFNKFGDAGLWCWVIEEHNSTESLLWMFGVLYFWIIAGGSAMTIFLVLVKINMKKRLKTNQNDDASDAYYAVVHNLTIYITGFIFCWLPAVVDRAYTILTGTSSPALDLLHATIVPLQGFVNAVIYGKFHIWVVRHVREPWVSDTGLSDKDSKVSPTIARATRLRQSTRWRDLERDHMGTATLFVTTFDMNWRPCPTNLEDWIPAGKDLYVFSLQHCVEVQVIEQAIRGYLIQVNYPTAYRSITSIAGTAMRGHVQDASVCQIVFVNNADDASGNVKFQAADGRIWAQRKTFDEVVGIPIRYFDASLAFVACNLSTSHASTSQRVDHLVDTLGAKHTVASSLIHSFGMDADRAAVDFPNLYHHTILAGNLNYNLDLSTSAVVLALDQAYKAESLKRATDAAIEVQMKAMRHLSTEKKGLDHSLPLDQLTIWDQSLDAWDSGQSSANVSSSSSSEGVLEAVGTIDDHPVPFTLLRSPNDLLHQTSNNTHGMEAKDPDSVAIAMPDGGLDSEHVQPWDALVDPPQLVTDDRVPATTKQHVIDRLASSDHLVPLARGSFKKIRDLLAKSDLVSDNTADKWRQVVQYDELLASIDAKEIFMGFEEPAIRFLPSFPRKLGVAAQFSMVGERSCRAFFSEASDDAAGESAPAYKDRILAHSLSDTKHRLTNVGYWSSEKIVTSTHKPVCSLYELEIDRFFTYNLEQAAMADLRQGKHALRDKRDVHEFKIQLIKLDANIWTYERDGGASGTQPVTHRRRGRESNVSSDPSSRQPGGLHSNNTNSSDERCAVVSRRRRSKLTIAHVVHRVLRTSRLHSTSTSSSRATTTPKRLSTGPPVHVPVGTTNEPLAALAASRLELVPLEPVSISTIFPLPSEDAYALQRKVYEVAHLVQNGFQSSARVDGDEESQLAYTNYRTVAWKEAMAKGVIHSAITKAVNGGVHVAISIKAEKGHGGQGVLCLKESDLMLHAAPVLSDAKPIPFDVSLTWGGKHVGYLHGDVLCSM